MVLWYREYRSNWLVGDKCCCTVDIQVISEWMNDIVFKFHRSLVEFFEQLKRFVNSSAIQNDGYAFQINTGNAHSPVPNITVLSPHTQKNPSPSSSSSSPPPKTLIKIKQKCNFQIQPTRKYSNLDKSMVCTTKFVNTFFFLSTVKSFSPFSVSSLQLWYYLNEFSVYLLLKICILWKPMLSLCSMVSVR